jgi:hypothetical protein
MYLYELLHFDYFGYLLQLKNQWRKNSGIYFSHRIRPPEPLPFLNSVKYLVVFFGKKITCRLHIETVAAKAYRTFIRLYFLFKSDRLSTGSKLTFHEALIRSIMTYACPAWEFAAYIHTYLMKFQRLQNKVIRNTGKFLRNSIRIQLYNQIMQATSPNNSTSREYTCSLYWTRRSPTQKI